MLLHFSVHFLDVIHLLTVALIPLLLFPQLFAEGRGIPCGIVELVVEVLQGRVKFLDLVLVVGLFGGEERRHVVEFFL